jgi:hypothetical protein
MVAWCHWSRCGAGAIVAGLDAQRVLEEMLAALLRKKREGRLTHARRLVKEVKVG